MCCTSTNITTLVLCTNYTFSIRKSAPLVTCGGNATVISLLMLVYLVMLLLYLVYLISELPPLLPVYIVGSLQELAMSPFLSALISSHPSVFMELRIRSVYVSCFLQILAALCSHRHFIKSVSGSYSYEEPF